MWIVDSKYYLMINGKYYEKKGLILLITLLICVITLVEFLYIFNILPHRKYTNDDFNIDTYQSKIDKDND